MDNSYHPCYSYPYYFYPDQSLGDYRNKERLDKDQSPLVIAVVVVSDNFLLEVWEYMTVVSFLEIKKNNGEYKNFIVKNCL